MPLIINKLRKSSPFFKVLEIAWSFFVHKQLIIFIGTYACNQNILSKRDRNVLNCNRPTIEFNQND